MCNNNLFICFVSAMEFSLPNLVVSIIFFVRLECTHAGGVSFISLSEFSFVMLSERSSPFLGTVLPCRQSCSVFFLLQSFMFCLMHKEYHLALYLEHIFAICHL